MSSYYNPRRTRNLYQPGSEKRFKLSRSKLELFTNCPRCYYLDRRLGIGQPPGFPFNLNSAVDALLKNEFDRYRARQVSVVTSTGNWQCFDCEVIERHIALPLRQPVCRTLDLHERRVTLR